ncbi:hypothetical protein AV530_000425 [Patagioenas fasciata monilis]|uniref:N-acetyltransferase domain-containing protein n=1 Tax=Patagioenas fasciata monilis TaxID=372326 RepID=A0A1V4KLD4_PATFA|nr:hypothetical protein AV530_000425 [Patagioenas fasciata monilis]
MVLVTYNGQERPGLAEQHNPLSDKAKVPLPDQGLQPCWRVQDVQPPALPTAGSPGPSEALQRSKDLKLEEHPLVLQVTRKRLSCQLVNDGIEVTWKSTPEDFGRKPGNGPSVCLCYLTDIQANRFACSEVLKGFGMLLMEEAERIAKEEHGSWKIAVISGVGTRNYYRKIGYELEGPYMVKKLE